MKHSRQREAIRQILAGRMDHPTADMIYDELRQIYPNISLGTVYRNLSLLDEIGEIRKVTGLGEADRFDPRTDRHCHFVCDRCGQVQDVDLTPSLVEKMNRQAGKLIPGGKVQGVDAIFHGICAECGMGASNSK